MGKLSLLIISLLVTFSVWSQQRTVRGRVADASGTPLGNVTVRVAGTNTATQTNQNGEFSITAAQGGRLVFSFVGFTEQQSVVGTSDNLNISLQRSNSELEAVVVVALGQTRNRDKIGYSASTFRAEDVTRSAPVSALDGLQGKVPGAEISTIGGVGSSSKIILRGYSSLGTTASNQPLIIVDGVPFNNSRLGSFNDFANSGGVDVGNGLNDLNPNDIENISILRGAAASSLYGSRAQNGVVIITTKRGRSGRLAVDFNSSTVFSSVGKLPDNQNSWGQGWGALHWKEENGSWGPRLDGRDRLWGSNVDNSRLIKPFSAVEDNVRDFYDQGIETNNSLSVRGGTEASQFYLSYGNVYSNGVLPADVDVYKRNTLALRGSTKVNNFLASGSFNYINKTGRTVNTDDNDQGSSTFEDIIQVPRDFPLTDLRAYENKFFNVDNYYSPYSANPYFSLFESGNKNQNDRFFGNVELGYDFGKSINIRWRNGLDVSNARLKDWKAIERPNPNTWRGPNPTNDEGAEYTAKVGGVRELSDYVGELNSDLILNYNYDVHENVNLSGFIGGNYNDQESRRHQSTITGLTIPKFYSLSNSANDPTTSTLSSHRRLFGAYAQVNLGYKDFLFFTVNGRNDWSSTLPQGKNSYFYPGANLSVVLSKLPMIQSTQISYWKMRAAIGRTGKDAPVYSLASTLVSGNTALGFGNIVFPLNGVSGFEIGNIIGNNALSPELTTELEIGTELRFFQDRIGLDFTAYRKRTEGQILNIPIAPSTGNTSLVTNFGLVENKGLEIALNLVPLRSKDLNWSTTFTFSNNRNKILELPEDQLEKIDFNSYFDVKMVGRVGRPIGVIEAPKPAMTEDGKFITSGGFYAAGLDDEEYGTIQRDFMMGLNNNFSYKNLSLGLGLDYRKGGYFVSRTADLMYFVGNAHQTQYNDRRPFIIPNSVEADGVDAAGKPKYKENITPIDMDHFYSYWYHSSVDNLSWQQVILPKDFFKLRDITLTYRLPQRWVGRIKAQGVSVSALARNLLIWVPSENTFVDPEATNLGNDILGEFGEQAAAPTQKSYGVVLKVNF
ncbi:MAG TPA: SusC/RagA family TonB-linked outer membrane protein [Chitinophagaceae bacterium]|nr:SusC/RagA family TonB-linked outer membrane protein [Chitinophagaceae bacterium]